jgi:hypothetical protein
MQLRMSAPQAAADSATSAMCGVVGFPGRMMEFTLTMTPLSLSPRSRPADSRSSDLRRLPAPVHAFTKPDPGIDPGPDAGIDRVSG